jgi:hypothetical protein
MYTGDDVPLCIMRTSTVNWVLGAGCCRQVGSPFETITKARTHNYLLWSNGMILRMQHAETS